MYQCKFKWKNKKYCKFWDCSFDKKIWQNISNIREEINKNDDVSFEPLGSNRDKVGNTFHLVYFTMIVRYDDCTWTVERARNDIGKGYSPCSTSDNWITRCDCRFLEGTTLQRGNVEKKKRTRETDKEKWCQISMERTSESDLKRKLVILKKIRYKEKKKNLWRIKSNKIREKKFEGKYNWCQKLKKKER